MTTYEQIASRIVRSYLKDRGQLAHGEPESFMQSLIATELKRQRKARRMTKRRRR